MARTVTPTYCQMMARYNAWQNDQMLASMSELSEDDLHEDQGAFFGSILKTASHIHWADGLWVSRFDGGEQLDDDPVALVVDERAIEELRRVASIDEVAHHQGRPAEAQMVDHMQYAQRHTSSR